MRTDSTLSYSYKYVYMCHCPSRKEFVEAYLCYVFSGSVSELYSAFSAGFLKVCGGNILSLFQPTELMAMVVGNDNYNWEEMEKVSTYRWELAGLESLIERRIERVSGIFSDGH